MEAENVLRIAKEWIYEIGADNSAEGEIIESKADDIFFMSSFKRPGLCWKLIKAVVEETDDFNVLASLAAGPLEELLAQHGAEYIEEVEKYSANNSKLMTALTGVYRNAMTDDVWARVKALQETAPIDLAEIE